MRSLRLAAIVCFLTILLSAEISLAQVSRAQSPEEKTAKYLESVRHQPGLLLAFLQQMPKGGDLHVHLSGAVYAESMIDWASENALCVDRSTSKLIHASCDSCEPYRNKPSVRCAYQDHILYDQLVDAWSMRNWHPRGGIGPRPFLRYVREVRSSAGESHRRCFSRGGVAGGGRSSAICGGDAHGRRKAGGHAGRQDWMG